MLIPAPSHALLQPANRLGSAKRRDRAARATNHGRASVARIPPEQPQGAYQQQQQMLPEYQALILPPQRQALALARGVPAGQPATPVEPPLGPAPDADAAQSWLRLGYDLGLLQSRSTIQEFSVALRDTVAKGQAAAIEAPPSQQLARQRTPSAGRRAVKRQVASPREGRRSSSPRRLVAPPGGVEIGGIGSSRPTIAQSDTHGLGTPGERQRLGSRRVGSAELVVAKAPSPEAQAEGRSTRGSQASLDSVLSYKDDSDAVRADALQQALSFTRAKLRAAAKGKVGKEGISVLEMEAKWLELQEIQLKEELERKGRLRRKLLGQLRGEAKVSLELLKSSGVEGESELAPLEERVKRLDSLDKTSRGEAARRRRLGLETPEEAAARWKKKTKQEGGWWSALEVRCRAQAKDEATRVVELRALLLKAVDLLGRGEIDRCFTQGGGRLDFVSFGRVISLALGDEMPDDDGIADMFGLVDPSATGVVRAIPFWNFVEVALADPLIVHEQLTEQRKQQRSRGGFRGSSQGGSRGSSAGEPLPLVLHHQKQEAAPAAAAAEAAQEAEDAEQEEAEGEGEEYHQQHTLGVDELRQLVEDVDLELGSTALYKLYRLIEREDGEVTVRGVKRWLAHNHPQAAEALLVKLGRLAPGESGGVGQLGLMDTEQEPNEDYARWVARRQLSVAATAPEEAGLASLEEQWRSMGLGHGGGAGDGGQEDHSTSTTVLLYRLARRRLDAQAAADLDEESSLAGTANQHMIATGTRSIFSGAVGVNSLLHFYDKEMYDEEARPFSAEDGSGEISSDTASKRSGSQQAGSARSRGSSSREDRSALWRDPSHGDVLGDDEDDGEIWTDGTGESEAGGSMMTDSRASSRPNTRQTVGGDSGSVSRPSTRQQLSGEEEQQEGSDGAEGEAGDGTASRPETIATDGGDGADDPNIAPWGDGEVDETGAEGGTEQLNHSSLLRQREMHAEILRERTATLSAAGGGCGGVYGTRNGTNFTVVLFRRADGFGLRLACDSNTNTVSVSEVLGAQVVGDRPGEFYPMVGDVVVQLQGVGAAELRAAPGTRVDGVGVDGLKTALLAVSGMKRVRWQLHRPHWAAAAVVMTGGAHALRNRALEAAHGGAVAGRRKARPSSGSAPGEGTKLRGERAWDSSMSKGPQLGADQDAPGWGWQD